MTEQEKENIKEIEDSINVRLDSNIYAFSTETVPNYLKVGDTFRGVNKRIAEWKEKIKSTTQREDIEIKKEGEWSALVPDTNLYFRDYSVHAFLTNVLKKEHLTDEKLIKLYSQEFFKDTKVEDVQKAIYAIIENAKDTSKPVKDYTFYRVEDNLAARPDYRNDKEWKLRSNQQAVVDNFMNNQIVKNAIDNKKNEDNSLLMYAVMRFGKSFTSMCCAKEMDAKKVLIVSAKADVCGEWEATVGLPSCLKDYKFLTDEDLRNNSNIVDETFNKENKKPVLFLTLQNLMEIKESNKEDRVIKERFKEVFNTEFDLIIIDETHYGAWANSYGAALRDKKIDEADEEDLEVIKEDFCNKETFIQETHTLKGKIKLHLSGTPYNLLYDEKFTSKNIIASCQFSDILKEKDNWDEIHFHDIENGENNPDTGKPYQEYDNPYYGFPKMLRFAFDLNDSAKQAIQEQNVNGDTYSLNRLFETNKKDSLNIKFLHEDAVLDLLKIIDGSKKDDNILSFLDIPKIKDNDVCKHIVMVMPYRFSCDAMTRLLIEHKNEFIHLKDYEVFNIAGYNSPERLSTVNLVKDTISCAEKNGKKTISLTVNRMLTGVTVKEWDTMIMLKNTKSAQEYDQAVFRIQNQYVKTYQAKDGSIFKKDMKPQTILVDFDPLRMFNIQGLSARIVNGVLNESDDKLDEIIQTELKYFPIIAHNGRNLVKVTPENIIEVITNYNKEKSLMDSASSINLEKGLLDDNVLRNYIEKQSEKSLQNSFTTDAHKSDKTSDFENPFDNEDDETENSGDDTNSQEKTIVSDKNNKDDENLEKKYRACILKILFYSFLTKSRVYTMKDILNSINVENKNILENKRIFKNLQLEKEFLEKHIEYSSRYQELSVDDLIANANKISKDESLPPDERAKNALNKFSRISDSEIVTPYKICIDILNAVGEKNLIKIVNDGNKILDIASKTGEFSYALCQMLNSKVDDNKLKEAIRAIPTSSITYELTRKIFEILDIPVENLAAKFNSYDLLNVKIINQKGEETKEIDYDRISNILTQDKKFSKITLEDELEKGEMKVNFEAVVGNPPYQAKITDSKNKFLPPIYHYFMDVSYSLSNDVVLIHPARFLFDGGYTPKKWNEKILTDNHFEIVKYYSNFRDVFPDTSAMGGIVITSHNQKKNIEPVGRFIVYDELRNIIDKINNKNFECIQSIIYTAESYHFTNDLYIDHPEIKGRLSKGHEFDLKTSVLNNLNGLVFFDDKFDDSIGIIGLYQRKKSLKWIKENYIKPSGNFNGFKVFLPKSNGSFSLNRDVSSQIIGVPFVERPGIGHTQTYMSIGNFNNEKYAENLCKYLKTKTARILIGALKDTQDNPAPKWKFVPNQNFSEDSDINWSNSIEEIDKQLYAKYNLTDEEISFVESTVKPMI